MANRCEICGKEAITGNLVSQSNIKTKRTTRPNIQRVKANVNGVSKRVRVCTRCIRSGKIEKRSK